MPSITPFLWFDNNAEAAMNFYASIFEDAKIGDLQRWPEGSGDQAGQVIGGSFTLLGQDFNVLNGGPQFKFNEAISFFISCDTQEEVDNYWTKLLGDGGEESMCGWLKDQFGLSWQVVPKLLGELMGDPDQEKASRTMQAMMKMRKIDCAVLQKAHDGE